MELRFGEWLKTILRIGIPIGRKKKAFRIKKRLLYIYLYWYVIEYYLTRERVVFKGQSYNIMLITMVKVYF